MNFEVLTLFPDSLKPIFSSSIIGRACEKGLISVNCTDIRDYTLDKHRKVDDTPYGGGYGMVMMCQPAVDCIRAAKARCGAPRTKHALLGGALASARFAAGFLPLPFQRRNF